MIESYLHIQGNVMIDSKCFVEEGQPSAGRRAALIDLDGPGFLRLAAIVPGIIPVSRATWYAGAGSIYPKPVPLGNGRAKGYRKSDIKALLQTLEEGGAA